MKDMKTLAEELMQSPLEALTERERAVLDRFLERRRVSSHVRSAIEDNATFGERLADRVARFGGSWGFIILFGVLLLAWIAGNTLLVANRTQAIDPYPFIFLNLVLSMLAALQAPVIMMSQNRQSAKDRAEAANDYEVNLKAELEIMQLHEKLDDIRQRQLTDLIADQARQLTLLEALLARSGMPK